MFAGLIFQEVTLFQIVQIITQSIVVCRGADVDANHFFIGTLEPDIRARKLREKFELLIPVSRLLEENYSNRFISAAANDMSNFRLEFGGIFGGVDDITEIKALRTVWNVADFVLVVPEIFHPQGFAFEPPVIG
ncbi:MAG TPA: hypothetical protein VLC92_10955 [Rhodocyclaceae bacterium]|nr:hypothetical protein [Rhodocyclaceae bacterium]